MKILPTKLSGEVRAIGAKAHAHRVLLASALAEGATKIFGLTYSEDVLATINTLKALGVSIVQEEDNLKILGKTRQDYANIDVGESGTTLRLILPILGQFADKVSITAHGRLPKRPLDALVDVLKQGGVQFSQDRLPCEVWGKFQKGSYALPGNISSQYFSGLLLAGGAMGEIEVMATTPLESKSYVDLTIAVLEAFQAKVEEEVGHYHVRSQGLKSPGEVTIEGDWSNLAPWLCAGALGGEGIHAKGVSMDSLQGDKAIVEILKAYGAKVSVTKDSILVAKGEARPLSLDMSNIPDLLPVLVILACGAKGESLFYNAKRLRYKETDRLERVASLVRALGIKVTLTEDSMRIEGRGYLNGGHISAVGDHRLVMAGALASCLAKEAISLEGKEAIGKSYPDFFETFRALGGQIDEF